MILQIIAMGCGYPDESEPEVYYLDQDFNVLAEEPDKNLYILVPLETINCTAMFKLVPKEST